MEYSRISNCHKANVLWNGSLLTDMICSLYAYHIQITYLTYNSDYNSQITRMELPDNQAYLNSTVKVQIPLFTQVQFKTVVKHCWNLKIEEARKIALDMTWLVTLLTCNSHILHITHIQLTFKALLFPFPDNSHS